MSQPPLRLRLHRVLEPSGGNTPGVKRINGALMALICLNILAMILESVDSIGSAYRSWFEAFDLFSVGVFSAEYLLRVWSCVESSRYAGTFTGRLRYLCSPMAIIDLLAIAPFYLPMIGIDLRIVRMLRFFRMFRAFKLFRYSKTLLHFQRILRDKREELSLSLMLLIFLLLFSSSLMYYAEHEAQPKAFASIPAAMWWAICTLTTVGYGDIYPVTFWGRMLASVIAILGIGMFALPTGILGAAFIEGIEARRRQHVCPHCGETFQGL